MSKYHETAYYLELGAKLPADDEAREYLKQMWFRETDASYLGNIQPAPSIDEPRFKNRLFDGVGYVPTFRANQTPIDMLDEAMWLCNGTLHQLGYNFQSDVRTDPEHYRLFGDGSCVCRFVSDTPALRPLIFSLGGHHVGSSTDEFRTRAASSLMTYLLEPAYALILITQWLAFVERERRKPARVTGGNVPSKLALRERPPIMFVECAGAGYSPDGNGKFNDVPRWDIYPPFGERRGLVFLNWNWSVRERPAQGVAFAALP